MHNRAEAEGVPTGERPAGEDESHGKIITHVLHNVFLSKDSLIRVSYTLHCNVHFSVH